MSISRRTYLSILGVVAWSTTAVDSVFIILDAASLSVAKVSFAGILIAASALDVVSLISVGVFSIHDFRYAWKKRGIVKGSLARRVLASSCILLSIMAMVLSLVALCTLKSRSRDVQKATSKAAVSSWATHLGAQFTFWALSCFSQIILFSTSLWATRREETKLTTGPRFSSGPRDSVMSEVRNSHQIANLHIIEPTQPSSPLAALPSPTFSARSGHSLKSWRDSLQSAVRPVTSRTKLINNRPSFNRDARSVYSDGYSIDNVSQSDGFETWDTSAVDPQSREVATAIQLPTRGTALEPIPGSRPASPARALDGPFPDTDGRQSPALTPPKMYLDTSRPPSPAISEAHIHPLFRTESPTPPPAATPGTSILASPLSSQIITCPPRPYSRMRSNSTRTTSPSPLAHQQSFQSLHERAMSPNSQRDIRSPSPPSRELTPPIPDFVLNSSPRSSFNSSRRKVSLQRPETPS
ncbi:hypothetical protein BDV96DRAFT_361664 [Lophiotrema nucula]|uniref:Uncharacterized protein n=1 Tax=Lophiotrema nucula TaxID=690887 RepID=A0A6A5ZGW5_9PLEO|nr:hypothetical protein BDV96DRAFT_361664 [Lophiotrema nucula]